MAALTNEESFANHLEESTADESCRLKKLRARKTPSRVICKPRSHLTSKEKDWNDDQQWSLQSKLRMRERECTQLKQINRILQERVKELTETLENHSHSMKILKLEIVNRENQMQFLQEQVQRMHRLSRQDSSPSLEVCATPEYQDLVTLFEQLHQFQDTLISENWGLKTALTQVLAEHTPQEDIELIETRKIHAAETLFKEPTERNEKKSTDHKK